MSTKSPRTFTREFKLDLCRQVHSGQKRPAQVCREHHPNKTSTDRRTAFALATRVRAAWRRGFLGQRNQRTFGYRSPGTEGCRTRTLLWATFIGEHSSKKVSQYATLAQRYAVITDYRKEHPETSVRQMCQMLGISRSWLYEKPTLVEPTEEDTSLRDAIERICLGFPGYGYRRVTAQLHRDGWTINHKKVLSVMRDESLLCRLQRAFRPPSPGSTKIAYPNLMHGLVVTKLDQVWVVDITYIRLPQGFVYLACVLDAFSRRCIGWHLSRDIDTRLTLAALNVAIAARRPSVGLIHHSDRGVQYASGEYTARLEEIEASLSMSKASLSMSKASLSMSAAGCPCDNAKAESFFKTLKKEEVYLSHYQTFEEARANLGTFLEAVYNVKRLHSSLGYLPPTEFEEQFLKEQSIAHFTFTSKS